MSLSFSEEMDVEIPVPADAQPQHVASTTNHPTVLPQIPETYQIPGSVYKASFILADIFPPSMDYKPPYETKGPFLGYS